MDAAQPRELRLSRDVVPLSRSLYDEFTDLRAFYYKHTSVCFSLCIFFGFVLLMVLSLSAATGFASMYYRLSYVSSYKRGKIFSVVGFFMYIYSSVWRKPMQYTTSRIYTKSQINCIFSNGDLSSPPCTRISTWFNCNSLASCLFLQTSPYHSRCLKIPREQILPMP